MAEAKRENRFRQSTVLFLISVFQVICAAEVILSQKEINYNLVIIFCGYIALEWLYMLFGVIITGSDYFELEAIAFFLSGIGLTVCATIGADYALKQAVAIGLGLITYLVMLLVIKNLRVAMALRYPAAIGSILLLCANLVLAKVTNGTLNWMDVGSFSVQPSEFVKVAFVLVGAVSLDKLLSNANLARYIAFSAVCIGALFIMRDFGTALIFFFTFILIAYLRSGDIRTIVLICTVALMGAMLIIYFKPYVANRFAAYRHVWEYMDTTGYQQTRVLIYSSSGGLFGLGLGEGKLRDIFAASTDLVFGVICEEMGIITGVAVAASFAFIVVYAIRAAKGAKSSFYVIASVAAAGMLLFQLMLNIFGITDLLPLTGVTLPFVSRGGSSLICSWGLLAYIRAAGAPFKLPSPDVDMSRAARRGGGAA